MVQETVEAAERRAADGKILASLERGVGLITINQPAKHNAMSLEMWDGLGEVIDDFAADPSVRVVILTGAGHTAFVSGADISQFGDVRATAAAQAEYERRTRPVRDRIAAFERPIIARIRGYCIGGGLSLALLADLRIAAQDSSFAIPAARLGIAYGPHSIRRLIDVVGPAHARMLLYTGVRIDATEAARMGLVNEVVPDARLSDRVLTLARMIADNAPLSIAASKRTVSEMMCEESERDTAAIERAIAACFDSADYAEGRAAFAEKRPPRFRGR